jgi:2-succinyl-6-hydroxy-2,4-cyclohexadiene-1-carboxylate synthase
MLHGFTGSPASFAALTPPRLALAPPLAGHAAVPASAHFWAEVERLGALVPDANKLFGYSLGARLSLGLLARYPRRFDQAVLVSAHPGLRTDRQRDLRRTEDDRYIRLLRERGLPEFVAVWEAQGMWRSQDALPATVRADKHRERLTHTAEGLARCLASVGLGQMPDLRAQLAQSVCSVEFLVGGQDRKFLEAAQELCAIMPRARLHVAENHGHDLVLECPQFCSTFLARGPSS